MNKIEEALDILKQINVPRKQQNDRSALTLLSLLSIKKNGSWKDAKRILIRIHDIMIFIKKEYGVEYAENSRETFRRQTLHQLEKEVGIVERNADDKTRPTNSPNTTWSIRKDVLDTISSYGTTEWDDKLATLMKSLGRNAKIKKSNPSLTIKLKERTIAFSPGKHNELEIDVLTEFKSHFCKDSDVVYVGDTANKMLYLDEDILRKLKFEIKKHDILPDVILLDENKKRLYLIEVVSSHGPVSQKRLIELTAYFSKLGLKLIFVSVFPDFKEFRKHVDDIAWETEVWLAEIPNHMIHFNGDKFLKLD